MLDEADLAIIETYDEVLSPLERTLLAEVRRLHAEYDDGLRDIEVERGEWTREMSELRSELDEKEREVDYLKDRLERTEAVS